MWHHLYAVGYNRSKAKEFLVFLPLTRALVTNVKFANENKDLVAFVSEDGTVSICSALKNPRLLATLPHPAPVNGSMGGTIAFLCIFKIFRGP